MTDFDSFLDATFGEDLQDFFQHDEIPTFLRANTLKTSIEEVEEILSRYGIVLEAHPMWDQVRRVVSTQGIGPGKCLHHFLGMYAVQSLGSMVPPRVLDPQPGERILDLCAAPGSKTTQIAAMMEGRGTLVANDLSGRRMNPLAAVLDGAGAGHVSLTNRDGSVLFKMLEGGFDRVLADVPCTGLGCAENVAQNRAWFNARGRASTLPDLQYRLLLSALKLVRVGGRVVYSTCSLSVEENEAVIDQILRKLPVELEAIEPMDGLVMREGRTSYADRTFDPSLSLGRRITPWENPSEGFFVAKLRKTAEFEGRYALQQDAEQLENTIDSLPMEAPEVMEVLEALEKTYGISPETFRPWRFLRRKKHLNLVPAHWDKVWGGAMRNGLTLSTFSTGFWRPSHTAVQTFREHFVKNILPLTDAQMRALITTGTTPIDAAQVDSFQSIWPLLSSEHVGGVFARGIHLEKGTIRWKKPRVYAIPGQSNDVV